MGADFSRIRANPLLDYAGVELKQGGVLLDADFNELVAVVDRRLRAAASDILGRATVSSTTPDAFLITAGGGTLNIGRGRLYVDGLLAENHGLPSAALANKPFDPLMAEMQYAQPLTYPTQPYLPQPPALPTGGRHLVYLDVWQREVTHIERPDLVEPAVNVETSSRVQTVWQVRVLPADAGTADCGTADGQVPGWSAITAPSTARLSTGTHEVVADEDPCELPPTGGYRGLENQTYRVEIHDAGQPGGTATFKWSRDNGSVVARVSSVISAQELELPSLGRDDVLRFNTGDWVEITDDVREFAQRSGEMRRITVDEAARRISFTPDLPADLRPAGPFPDSSFPATRNLRVRRWDQGHEVLRVQADGSTTVFHDLDANTATGAIPVPAAGTTLLLERSVTVTFRAAAGPGGFRAGDRWVFAARTADASVEALADAPPRGIHHHYARLGFWNVATGTVTDCRTKWPPPVGDGDDCSCDACVTPESHASGQFTIQAAVDQVRAQGGGTVCLAIGQYALRDPVRINDASSLHVVGKGLGTVLTAFDGAFSIDDGSDVSIEDLAILSTGAQHAIHVQGTVTGLRLEGLAVVATGDQTTVAAIRLDGILLSSLVRGNMVLARNGIVAGGTQTVNLAAGSIEVPTGFLMSALMRIEDNILVCGDRGIDLTGLVLHVFDHAIQGNEFVGCRLQAIRLLGLAAVGTPMLVCDNGFQINRDGIVAGVDGLRIEGNKLHATRATGSDRATGTGILLGTGLDTNGSNEAQVLANQIRGFEDAGISVAAPVRDLIVKLNILTRCGNGIVVEDEGDTLRVSIENNHLSDIGVTATAQEVGVAIAVARADAVAVSGNTIQGVGQPTQGAGFGIGIVVRDVDTLRLAHNSVVDVGPRGSDDNGIGIGVLVRAPLRHADVAHNHIERESVPLYTGGGRFTALWIDAPPAGSTGGMTVGGSLAVGPQATNMSSLNASAGATIGATPTASAGNTTVIFGSRNTYLRAGMTRGTDAADAAAAAALSNRPHASIAGNTVGSRGALPAVLVRIAGDCLFGDNRCEWRAGGTVAVFLEGDAAVVNANRVHGGETSIRINSAARKATVLGNITTGAIELGGIVLPAPWAALNAHG